MARLLFKPILPTSIGLFRIAYGLLLLAFGVLLKPDWLVWYGTRGVFPIYLSQAFSDPWRWNIFLWIPHNDAWVMAYYYVFMLFAFFVTIGFCTRFSSIAIYILLTSLHNRDIYLLNSGDIALRVVGFWVMFSAAGKAFSVDRWWSVKRGKEPRELQPCSPWAQRFIQIQMAFIYISAFWWKCRGRHWTHGTALYYILFLEDLRRFPLPSLFHTQVMIHLMTWGTMAMEFSAGIWGLGEALAL